MRKEKKTSEPIISREEALFKERKKKFILLYKFYVERLNTCNHP